ncbi:MAG: TIGR01212 family radical SAM protein [Defluviitaleaceae bacterium]|nr:TIGR01212 family radical SAM protein [Defluviitaleaceae bacterium]
MDIYSDGKRFLSLNNYLRTEFGGKVFKISLDGGFSCPNRDGTAARGGCTFCSDVGSGDFVERRYAPLDEQFELFKNKMHQKWANGKYIAYFQAFTNTHAPVSVLRERFEPILREENVVGLSIATRPDCLPDDVTEYLAELNQRTSLWVELGLQTIFDDTARAFNRGYDFEVYLQSIEKLRKHGIRVCTHIINGLPGEDYDMMMQTARTIAKPDVQGIKIHLLNVLRNTPMAALYESGEIKLFERDEYVALVCDQLEILPPEMVIHRLTADAPRDKIIGPLWNIKKWETLNAIDRELERRNSWQGKFCE